MNRWQPDPEVTALAEALDRDAAEAMIGFDAEFAEMADAFDRDRREGRIQ